MLRRTFVTGILSTGSLALLPAHSAFAANPLATTPGDRQAGLPSMALPNASSVSTTLNFLDARSEGESYDLQGTITHRGQTVSDALLYVWQVDEAGIYDRDTFRYHGIALTDSAGRFELSSIIPEGYFQRRVERRVERRGHLHVAVMIPSGETLSTELFFPLETHAAVSDPDYDPRLLVNLRPQSQSRSIATVNIKL